MMFFISIKVSLPSGKRLNNYGKSPFFMGKSTISMAIFNTRGSLSLYGAGHWDGGVDLGARIRYPHSVPVKRHRCQ